MKKILLVSLFVFSLVFAQKTPPAAVTKQFWKDSTTGGVRYLVPKDPIQIPPSAIYGGTGGGSAIADSIAAHEIGTNGVLNKIAIWRGTDSLSWLHIKDSGGVTTTLRSDTLVVYSSSGGAMTKQAIMDTMAHTYIRNNEANYTIFVKEEFSSGVIATQFVSPFFQSIVSGTGAAINFNTGNPDSTWGPGVATASTGTTNAGYANLESTIDGIINANGETYIEGVFRFPVLATTGGAGENYCFDFGFLDNAAAAEPTDGAFIRYDSTHADLRIILRSNATIDTTNVTGVTLVANTNYKTGISISGYTVKVWINDALVGDITSLAVPRGTARAFGVSARIYKKSLATARTVLIDRIWGSKTFTTPRY